MKSIKKSIAVCALMIWAPLALAMTPYIKGDKVSGGDLTATMTQVEGKLKANGFDVIGKYQPKGIADSGVVIVTDKALLGAIEKIGGDVIAGAAIRVGVKADGSVSYINPEYWYRAYFRDGYSANEAAVKNVESKLKTALGAGEGFGGDVKPADLAKYHYMFGMERFEDNRELNKYASFEKAVETVRANLAKGSGNTSKVYEIVMADKKIAVFGVAMNDPKTGDGYWVNKIEGTENIAALPYEIFVVGDKAEAFFGRYRIALSWSALKMTSFGKIMATPGNIKSTLKTVAGAE
jgi:hypothetical protein